MTAANPYGLHPSTAEAALPLPFGTACLHAASTEACPPPHYPRCAPLIPVFACMGYQTYHITYVPDRQHILLYENTGTEVNSAPGWPSNAPRRPRLWATGYIPFSRACFHLLQVEINIHPQHTSAKPASAAHAHPGIHRNSSNNPALMNTHPSIFQIPSAEGWGGSHWP